MEWCIINNFFEKNITVATKNGIRTAKKKGIRKNNLVDSFVYGTQNKHI